ncbi:hypothetical protein SUGI_0112390 [Cryptomeria japonica]|nr:hypothetical protein SUGI_0112390 [Cryptomeria japonica]
MHEPLLPFQYKGREHLVWPFLFLLLFPHSNTKEENIWCGYFFLSFCFPDLSPSPGQLNRQGHYSSSTPAVMKNVLFMVSVVLFTMTLIMPAFRIFFLCFKRICRRRLTLESREASIDLRRLPHEKTAAERFHVFVYESKNYSDRGFECAVCLCELEEREKGRILPGCKHSFHVDSSTNGSTRIRPARFVEPTPELTGRCHGREMNQSFGKRIRCEILVNC